LKIKNIKKELNQSLGVTGKYSSLKLKNGGDKNKTKLQQARKKTPDLIGKLKKRRQKHGGERNNRILQQAKRS